MIRSNYSTEEIIESMQFVNPHAGEAEIKQLQENLAEEKRERARWDSRWRRSEAFFCSPLWDQMPSELKAILSDPTLRRCLLVALALVTLQMCTGQGAILYFAGTIFEDICPSSAGDCIIGLGVSKLVSSYSMLFIADSFGRRDFLLGGLLVMIVGMVLLCCGIAFDESIASILGINLAVIGYELGLGTMLMIMLSELFPRFVRSAAVSIAVALLCGWDVAVTFSLPFLESEIGLLYVFVLFGMASVLAVIVVYLFVPDTRGVDLEEAYKLVRGTCNASLGPVGLGIDDEDSLEMPEEVCGEGDGLLAPKQ